MDKEIYDDLDELPAPPRVDIPAADLVLLERAARAIGAVRVEVVDGEGFVNLHFADGSVVHSWNPLMFSGDAFDLVVSLGLSVGVNLSDEYAIAAPARQLERHEAGCFEDLNNEPGAATRRAITRAASEIGT